MPISLVESQAVSDIAALLYNFLPGKPHPYANKKISFEAIANDMNLTVFWIGGSKLPAINYLLCKTLEQKRSLFCNLVIEIVNRGMIYRKSKKNPITREEIVALNKLISIVNFKIPELWNSTFLNSLPSTTVKQNNYDKTDDNGKTNNKEDIQLLLKSLLDKLLNFEKLEPQKRGYAFEDFLKELFSVYGLKPRSSFKLVGEQIDGSLELDSSTYLIEAKWQKNLISIKELLAFHGKVDGKASWSRGIYISYAGFSTDGIEAFGRGRATNIITMTGQDIYFILNGNMSLVECIRKKARWAAETGEINKSAYDLMYVEY